MTRELIEEADLILVMTPTHYRDVVTVSPEARDRTFLLKRFPDPGMTARGSPTPSADHWISTIRLF